MLKRGGREGPNVTNPTLTHDRPTKLFAFLTGHSNIEADGRVPFPQWWDCSQLLTFSDSLKNFISVSCGRARTDALRLQAAIGRAPAPGRPGGAICPQCVILPYLLEGMSIISPRKYPTPRVSGMLTGCASWFEHFSLGLNACGC